MNTLTSGLCSSQASPWMPPFSPHPCLTNSYHPSRPSSRPTSLLRAEWVSPVSVLSQPLGQCDGAPKSACDQSACVHRPLSWDSEPGGQGAFPCFICLLATSLGLPCAPFLSPYSSLFPQSFLPIWLSHWFPLLLPHCWSLHQSGRPVLCWIHEDPSGCGALEAAGVEPPAPRCVPGCWPCCLLSGLRESHCQAMTDPLGPVSMMGKDMLSKSLIQFSVDGWSCVPSLLFTWGQTMVEVMKIMATSFRKSHACTAAFHVPEPAAGHC